MKVALLAGGFGTRLAEETEIRPKPMVEIGNYPILWHIMSHYAQAGFTEFCIALGYKGEVIKRYFLEYPTMNCSSMSVSLRDGHVEMVNADSAVDWTVHLIDTGIQSMTGGRVRRMRHWLGDSTFMLTYGDGVSNVDLHALIKFHRERGCIATLTAVRPPARFGTLQLDGDTVMSFAEKSPVHEGWINGGFFVMEPTIFDYIQDDQTVLESDVLERLAREGQLAAYRHDNFWQCMDTLRDKRYLEGLWQSNKAPWKTWE